MKYLLRIFVVLLAISVIHSCSKDEIEDPDPQPPEEKDSVLLPGKELRGVWIATVWELDWPQGARDIEAQKQQYIDYLEQFQELNIKDRKSTRLNSSHVAISYAVFCLKK